MREREIFRYSSDQGDFIGVVSDLLEDVWEQETLPEYKETVRKLRKIPGDVLWLEIRKTNKCAKKSKGYKKSLERALYESGNGDFETAWGIRNQVIKWLRKERPEFLAIGAYRDSNYGKRWRVYHQILTREGYVPYRVEKDFWTEPIMIYARKDLGIKYPKINYLELIEDPC